MMVLAFTIYYFYQNIIISNHIFYTHLFHLSKQKKQDYQQKVIVQTKIQHISTEKHLMINPLFLPQNVKRRKKSILEETPQNTMVRKQLKLIHQLDCIYQGEVNNSYQKEGFGMQQTNDFHMYLGFWKCNRTNGIGMIIYPEGGLIYGNFKDNQIFGLALVDNKRRLRIGIFENSQIAGIGFEYNYADSKWKFSHFHRGVSIQTISEAVSPIEKGPPSMMNLHEDMCILLSKYLNQQFFDIPVKSLVERPYRSYSQMNVHKIDANYIYFGQIIDGKYWGLGLIFDKVNGYPIQTGYYQTGQLNGYGLKYDKDKSQLQMGLYIRGKKEGFFFEKRNRLQTIVEYQKNYCKGQNSQMTRQKLKTTHKIYNYQKKDFFSEKNKINFKGLRILIESEQKQTSKYNQTFRNATLTGAKKSDKLGQKDASPTSDKKPGKYVASQINVSKSTVQVIREKLGDIENIIKRSKAIVRDEKLKKQQKKEPTKKGHFLQVTISDEVDLKLGGVEDDEIYQEMPPVSKDYDISDFYKENTKNNASPRARSPRTARKTRSPVRFTVNNTTGNKQRSPETTGRLKKGQTLYFYEPKTSQFALSPAKNDRSVSASKRKKRRIFE